MTIFRNARDGKRHSERVRRQDSAARRFAAAALLILLAAPGHAWALRPDEILVVSNNNFPHSNELAEYYMRERGVPAGSLLRLDAPVRERCTRREYDEEIAAPVRSFLNTEDPKGYRFRCLLMMHGIPLTVSAPVQEVGESIHMVYYKVMEKLFAFLFRRMESINGEFAGTLASWRKEFAGKILEIYRRDQMAALDSEIALVQEDYYPLPGWIPSPFFLGSSEIGEMDVAPTKAFMVARLDGPSWKIVRRLIDDSVRVEKQGLKGTAYFDARWSESEDMAPSGYTIYDDSIRKAARRLEAGGLLPVVLEDTPRLFQPGECPDAALYCGWYSVGNYVDSFGWVPGSIGYHIASKECITVRQALSNVWCKLMLEKGVTATIGPVGEPFVQAFPLPELFFTSLTEGRLSLMEAYALSSPYLSWKMILIGDPLYTPFKNAPK